MTQDIAEIAREANLPYYWTTGVPCNLEALERFAKLVEKRKCQELARKIQAMPFGDTAESFAIWVLEQA